MGMWSKKWLRPFYDQDVRPIFDILLLAKSETFKSLLIAMYESTNRICVSLSALAPCENKIDCNNKGYCIHGTCSCNNGWEESSQCLGKQFILNTTNKISYHTPIHKRGPIEIVIFIQNQ
jgi:hypothetical protein